ncbi:Ig-like domain repeat protein [Treponema sp. OMZ 855]|uniref:Ig-like domain repeat protein n=1 Tax=Treponema sp. OMZ 855 TaxID=1643512 RepID=UPI0020A399AF|nr:Ig-like domain repeat protein [Treponema sp. OMZ 855]UTC49774.1 Ig-like domain repeat protein [Treponema sp. OMZ 855]
MKKMNRAVFLVLIILTALAGITCKPYVGLGGQIDILPPSGEITYPDAGEMPIRGSFVLKGTAKDDEGVTSVSIVFVNIETNDRKGPFYAAVSNPGVPSTSWKADINNEFTGTIDNHPLVKVYPIPDGEYTATVTVTDKGGKTSTFTQNYKIDNTPPVFIVERPSLSAANDAVNPSGDQYGAVMKITGSAADMYELRSVTLKVNDSLSITKKNKETSVDLVMASDPDSDYTNLLNAAGGNDKPLKAVIALQDNARICDDATADNDNRGNESAFYYIKNELEADLDLNKYTAKVISDYFSGKKGKNGGTPHEQAVYDLRHTDEAARNVLLSKRIISNTTKSVFSLNPAKTPGFKLVGISPFIDQPNPPLMQFSSTTALTVELYPNRDGNALVAGTDYKTRGIKVSLCEGQTAENLKNGIYTGEKVLFDAAADNADFSGVELSGNLIKITKLLPADTKPGLYRINVEGTDVKNNSGFVPYGEGNKPSEGYFIIKLEATGAPYIFFRTLKTYQKADFDIFCDVKNLSGGKVDYNFDADPTGTPASSGPSLLTLDSPDVYKRKVSTSGLPEGNHTVHVRAYKSDVLFNTAYVPFIFDKTDPSPAVLTDPVETENHTFSTWSHTFKGTAADKIPTGLQLSQISNIDKVTYRVGTKANSSAPIVYKPNESPATLIDPVSSSDPYKWEAVVSFGQKKDNYLRVSIYDKAGNKTDTDFGPYEVNTDSPQIKFEDIRFSLGTTYSEPSPVTLVKQNAVIGNGVSENNKKASFKVFAHSTFEIESVKVSVGGGEKAGTKTGTATDGYEEWTVNDVPLVEGNPNFKLYVKSKSGTLTEWQTPVIVDFTAPKVKQSSPDLHGIFFKEIQLMGTIIDEVSSGSGMASGADADTVKYKIGNSGFVTEHKPGGVEWSKLTYSGGAWTINISDIARYTAAYGASVPSGGTIHSIPIQIQVSDKAGNLHTSDVFTIKFDPAGGTPFADLTAPKQGDRLGGDILISGSAHVANPASGKTVKEIYLQMGKTRAELESNTAWTLNGTNYGAASGVKIYPASGSPDVYYWNYTLPSEVRADILGSDSSKEVFLRVKAKNVDGVFSEWTQPISFTINTDVAKFSQIQLQKGTESNPYTPNSVWLKGDDFKITGSVSHSAGIQNTIKAESAAQLPQGYEKLDTSNTSGWFTQANIGSDRGYNFAIPIKTSHYTQKAGNIQFDISAIDARTDGTPVPVSYMITLKYDNSKPTVAAGVHKVKSDTAVFTGGQFVANLDNTKKDLYRVLVNNQVYKVHSITGTNVVLSDASSLTGSFDYGIVEQPKMIYDDGSDYQITGIASDTGSGVQKVTAKLEVVKGGLTKSVSVDMTADHASNKISTERGNMVSFKGSLKTKDVPNGKGRLTVTAYDGNGNEISETITNVIVKNKPLEIKKIVFKTDLSGDGDYNDPNETFESTDFGSLDANRDFTGTVNAASEFTFKNPIKSQLIVTLKGGYGESVKVSLLNGSNVVKSVSVTPNASGHEYHVDLDLSNVLNIGDAVEKALVLKVEDESIGTVPSDPPAPPTPAPTSPYWCAQADITVGVDVVDDVTPTGFIMPMYYNSDDSRITKPADLPLVSVVYDVETDAGVIKKVKEPAGHIEISGISSINAHPCVSGKVMLRGIAYDNIRLKKLELSGAGISGVSNEFTNGAWSATSPLKIVKKGLSNTGHYVEWEYEWTTGTPALAQTVTLNVTDAASKTNAAGKTEPAEKIGTRNGDRGMTLASDTNHTAVKHQFIRLYEKVNNKEGKKSYLVQVDTVSADGKTVTWKDTSVPTGITSYRLYDKNSNNTAFAVNIVPYITKVTTKLSDLSSNASVYNRTALGKYPVADAEEITIEGFNLSGAEFKLNGTDLTASGTKYKIGSAKSGALVAKVGQIESINNINDDTKPYNQEPNKVNNDLLTDDRFIDVWQFKQAAKPANGFISYPVLKVSPKDGSVGLAYANGVEYFNMAGFGNTAGQTDYKSARRFDQNWAQYVHTDFVFDEYGYTYGMATGVDMNSGDSGGVASYSKFVSRRPGEINNLNNYGSNGGAGKPPRGEQFGIGLRLENIGTTNNPYTADPDRIQSPSITTVAGNATNEETFIYLAYYDAINQHIRYRWGSVSKKTNYWGNPEQPYHKYDGQLIDLKGYGKMQEPPASSFSILAGPPAKKYPGDNGGSTQTGTVNNSGKYVSLAAVKAATAGTTHDVVTAVWYNFKERSLMYSYAGGTETPRKDNVTWSAPVKISSGGEYVRSVADPSGGIHVAFYDSGNLKYAYLPAYNNASWSVVIVDSYSLTGTHVSIDLARAKTGGKWIPYISYYMQGGASAKLAYLVDETAPSASEVTAGIGSGSIKAGALTDERFTGAWEVSIVPATNMIREYRINVGVYKDSFTGVIKEIPTASGTVGTDEWIVGGNGTANPILGYAVAEDGAFETAQKK